MSEILEANARTRMLGLWDDNSAVLAEYEDLRQTIYPEGGQVTVEGGRLWFAGNEAEDEE